jgi:hypothetical protein
LKNGTEKRKELRNLEKNNLENRGWVRKGWKADNKYLLIGYKMVKARRHG